MQVELIYAYFLAEDRDKGLASGANWTMLTPWRSVHYEVR